MPPPMSSGPNSQFQDQALGEWFIGTYERDRYICINT